MVDIAALAIEVDTRTVKSAVGDLGRLSAASATAADASREVGQAAAAASAGIEAEGAAARKGTAALTEAGRAHTQLSTAVKATSFQTRNLQYQMIDIAQGLPLLFQSPLYGLINLANQGAQIAQIYGPNEGGVARAFKEAGAMAVRFAAGLAPIVAAGGAVGIMFEGWTREINKAGHATVTFMDTMQAAFELARDGIGKLLSGPAGDFMAGLDKVVKNTNREINGITGVVVGVYKAITRTWDILPQAMGDAAYKAAQAVLDAFVSMGRQIIATLNGIIAKINGMLRDNGLKQFQLNMFDEPYKVVPRATLNNPYAGSAAKAGSAISQAFSESMGVDYTGNLVSSLGSKAQEIHNRPTKEQLKAAEAEAKRQKKAYDDLIMNSKQFVQQQQLETKTLGMTEGATARLRKEQELLNKAADEHIKLSPIMRAELINQAHAMADAETAASKMKDTYDYAKETFQGFFEDFRSGMQSGESAWSAFSSAAQNALNSIASKLLDLVTSKAFDALIGATGGGAGGGLLSSLAGLLGFANGGAFMHGQVTAFANGGIVTRPTIFPMARGMGLMGEAGPEAVMPLRRGRDGRLGVQAAGAGGGSVQHNYQIAVEVKGTGDKELEQKLSRAVTTAVETSRRSLPKWQSDYSTYRG